MAQALVVEVDKKGTKKVGFKAKKIEGRGIGKGNCWGELVFLGDQNFTVLNASHQGKIIFLENIDAFVLSKAKALEVEGLIGLEIDKNLKKDNYPLPILLVADGKKLSLAIREAKGVKCLLDINNNCLLIPACAGKPNDH